MTNNHICNSTVVVKASVLKNIAYEIPQLFQYEDWLLWILLADIGEFVYLPRKLAVYRYHADCATAMIDQKPLSGLYSKLELYLAVSARSNSKQHTLKAEELATETLRALKRIYSNRITTFY